MSKTKLRPCPFCGSEDAYIFPDDAEGECVWWVCRNCGIEGPVAKTKRAASKRWNERPGTDINDQIGCLCQIRCLLGDKEVKLMQDEIIERVRELADHFRETTKKAKRREAAKGEGK